MSIIQGSILHKSTAVRQIPLPTWDIGGSGLRHQPETANYVWLRAQDTPLETILYKPTLNGREVSRREGAKLCSSPSSV